MIEASEDVRSIDVTSSAFGEGGPIPEAYSCQGQGKSPPLSWKGGPPSAKSFVVLVTDPDAPGGTFDHWGVYNLSASVTELPEGAAARASDIGFEQSVNDFGDATYGAVCPPPSHGAHEYRFQVAALDVESLDASEGTPRQSQLVDAARAHVIGAGTLTGDYNR
jgi:Raf kinase inhibitor-like YbhB/YbcL family protein